MVVLYRHKLSAEVTYSLQEVWQEIFDLRFLSWINVPQARKYSIVAILNFFENSQRYLRNNVYHRCQQHRRKIYCRWTIIAIDNNTSDKFIRRPEIVLQKA